MIKNEAGDAVRKGIVYIGSATNNQAEYTALEHGLIAARAMGIEQLLVKGDSDLVIRQVKAEYMVHNTTLLQFHARIMKLVADFTHIEFAHIPRDMNSEADEMANMAMDTRETKTIL